MIDRPLVSVILPAFNCRKVIRPALESVLDQTYRNLEVIVVDDGSTDGTSDTVREFALRDPRVVLVRHARNQGIAAALNDGIELARGQYIARQDADDVSHPQRLEYQVAAMCANAADIVGTRVRYKRSPEREVAERYGGPVTIEEPGSILGNPIAHGSVMGRAEIFKSNRYDPTAYRTEDVELWLRLRGQGYVFRRLAIPLYLYRVGQSSAANFDQHRAWLRVSGHTALERLHGCALARPLLSRLFVLSDRCERQRYIRTNRVGRVLFRILAVIVFPFKLFTMRRCRWTQCKSLVLNGGKLGGEDGTPTLDERP